jgi:hypothetical protein
MSIFCRKRIFDLGRDVVALGRRGLLVGDVEVEVGRRQVLEHLVGTVALGVELTHQLVVLDDHPLGCELRGELDALGGFLVGRVGGADEQAVAALAEHDQLVLGRDLVVDDVARQLLQIDRSEVEQRQRQRGRQRVREVVGLDGTGGDHRRDETALALLGALGELACRLGAQLARIDQHASHARQGRRRRFDKRFQCHGLGISVQGRAYAGGSSLIDPPV